MDSLRVALLVIGIAIIAAIYWNARRKQAAEIRNSDLGSRIEPALDELDGVDETPAPREPLDPAPRASTGGNDRTPARRPSSPTLEPPEVSQDPDDEGDEESIPQKVITLRIVGRSGKDFSAEEVVMTLRGVGLQHGRFGIFHRMSDDSDADALFSVANLTEPGTFELDDLRDRRLAGLSFFMLRPGPGRGVDAFDKMVETARAVAISLQGELLDGDGSSLSIQRERFMREDLIQYELKHLKL